MKNCIELSNALNDLGNALTAAQWPAVPCTRYDGAEQVYDLKEVYRTLVGAATEVMHEADDLQDCVNQLCIECGKYHESYLGACDGCRWLAVKEGFR